MNQEEITDTPGYPTPATYSVDESASIHEMFVRPDVPLLCPRCAAELTVSPPIESRSSIVQEVCCPSCHRCIIVKDRPERPATQ